MRNKYKVALFRLNLLIVAGLLGYQAVAVAHPIDAGLLGLATVWLVVSALLLEFSHRRHAYRPWLMVPSILLTSLVTLSPAQNSEWLWIWPCLLLLPQNQWMLVLNICLAGFSWWWLLGSLSLHHWLFAGAILTIFILLAVARSLPITQRQRSFLQRARLAPGLPLWPLAQLERDLPRETSRATRDGVHTELVLVQTSPLHLWPLAHHLCKLIHRFENVYHLNGRTLGMILTSTTSKHAQQRRNDMLEAIDHPVTVRVAQLSGLNSLSQALDALDRQAPSTHFVEGSA